MAALDYVKYVLLKAFDPSGAPKSLKVDAGSNLLVASSPVAIWSQPGVTPLGTYGQVENGTTILRTVPGGKTLYITGMYLAIIVTAATAGGAYIRFRDGADVDQLIWKLYLGAIGNFAVSIPFSVPYPVAAGWDVTVVSDAASHFAYAVITGFEA